MLTKGLVKNLHIFLETTNFESLYILMLKPFKLTVFYFLQVKVDFFSWRTKLQKIKIYNNFKKFKQF